MQASGLLLVVVLEAACGHLDPCGNKILRSVPSPGGRHNAIVFQRDCGATTAYSTQVSVVRTGEEPRERPTLLSATKSGNAFVVDKGGGRPDGWRGGGPWVEVEWSAGDTVVVRYDLSARVFRKNGEVDGVQVRYERVAPPPRELRGVARRPTRG